MFHAAKAAMATSCISSTSLRRPDASPAPFPPPPPPRATCARPSRSSSSASAPPRTSSNASRLILVNSVPVQAHTAITLLLSGMAGP